MAQDERRRYARLNALVDVACNKHPLKPGKKSSLRLSKNISKEGICLIVYEKVNKGDLMDLKVYFPDTKVPVQVLARVVWVSEFTIGDAIGKRYDVGFEFMKIKEADKNKISQYVFSHKIN
jgi:c-di-GMP-binding flagellar brake protein YcgR